jgi:phosphate transport system ATP-binding protein
VKIRISDLSVWFGAQRKVRGVSLDVAANEILAIMGPAQSGKTTMLRTLNRMDDEIPSMGREGSVHLDGRDILLPSEDVANLRRRLGMVFAVPTPVPGSIAHNVTLGPRFAGIRDRGELLEKSLKAAFLWDEVKERLDMSALNLSGGQQQRLCLARTLALQPEVLLLDEPTSGLDPISTAKIEEALRELKRELTVILVTNNVKQAARASDRTAFMLSGELVEVGPTQEVFLNPKDQRTLDYVSGRFG